MQEPSKTNQELIEEISLLKQRIQELEKSEATHALAQEKLNNQMVFIKTLLDTIPSPIFYKDTSGIYLGCNRAFEEITGQSREEVTGKDVYGIYPKNIADVYREKDQELYARPGNQTYDGRFKAADGTIKDVIINKATYTDTSNNIAGVVGVFIDISERKQAEEALHKSEERFRQLAEVFPETIFEADLDGKLTYINEHGYHCFGINETDIEHGIDIINMVIPEARQIAQQRVRERIEGKTGGFLEYKALRKNGQTFDAMAFTSPIRTAGEVTGIRGFVLDVTARKNVEKELLEAKERLSLAARAGGVGIWDYNVVNNSLVWDDQMFRLYGITHDSFGGAYEAWQAGVHPEDRKRSDKEIQAALRGEKDFDTEFRVIWPDGTIRNIRALALVQRDAAGLPLHMIGTNWDITDQKQAEKALRDSEETIRLLLDSVAEAIYGIDMNGNCTFCNNQCLHLLGYKHPDDLLGKNMHGKIHSKHPDGTPFPVAECRIYQAFHDGKGTHADDEVLWRADDTSFPAEYWSYPLLRDGLILGAVVTFLDITERKKAEENLLETNRLLTEATVRANDMALQATIANTAKSEFLANMSHEIRTPMNGVIGMTGLLLNTELSDEQRRYAETVRTSGESLLALLNDILDFSKIEAGKLELETLDFDLCALLDDFAATMALRAHDKGIEFICAAAPDVPDYLRGDPGRLRQILTNLTGNAVKFTPKGEIALRASLVSETDIEAVVRFSIKDTGIGIPLSKQSLLFQKFTQADASTTRQYGGTGLGLAISKQLAEMMGGEIGFKSEEGRGAEFWFTACFARQTGRKHKVFMPAEIRGVHILIVDDNATNREVLMHQLTAWEMRVEEAPDGPTALHMLYLAREAGDPYQIAILDMQMPGMDGISLGRVVKIDDTLKDTKLVLLSSLGRRGDAKHIEEIGFAAYLTKPARQSDLHDCLSTIMGVSIVVPHEKPIITRHTIREMRGGVFRILLAEDNITNQQVAIGILKKMGLRADAVANGAEAVKALETLPYDLVLMDVQMPVMDGIQATQQIRNPKSAVINHHIPIIAMTAHAMQGDREKFLNVGMNDYVSKPVSPDALADALDRWLPKETTAKIDMRPVTTPAHAPAAVGKPVLQIFDKQGMMARMGNDEDLAREIIVGFLDDIPKQISALRGYLEAGDTIRVERQAHTIKGASASLGGEALRMVAFEMEKAGKAGELEVVGASMPELETQFDRLKIAMNEFINGK